MDSTAAFDRDVELLRQGVHNGNTDPMEPTGKLVVFAGELAPSV
jgi:hypothetical protein